MRPPAGLLTFLALVSFLAHAQSPSPSPAKGAERLLELSPLAPPNSPSARTVTDNAPIQIRIGPANGWDRVFTLSNGKAEVVVVPEIGRVMQFRFPGEPGPFWEDPALHGHSPDPASTEWQNFGGDKTWPSPQARWNVLTPRAWPPPVAFDAQPVEVSVRRDTLVLTSPVDPHYGIRTERVLQMPLDAPQLTIVTSYEKVDGDPLEVGIWIITQLIDPLLVAAPVPVPSRFPDGYNRQSGDQLPAQLHVDRRLLSLTRDPQHATKIGMDTDRLLWIGRELMLLIESPRVQGARYPDQESSAEIYTNPNPKTYVELEMLGPLHLLKPGDRISQTNTYTLLRRAGSGIDAASEARQTLRLP